MFPIDNKPLNIVYSDNVIIQNNKMFLIDNKQAFKYYGTKDVIKFKKKTLKLNEVKYIINLRRSLITIKLLAKKV